ncbi:Fanconi anemia group B protein [Spinachia spinachia]
MESSRSEDCSRKPHRLSARGKMILFDCGERSELTFRSLSFAREANAFARAGGGAAAIGGPGTRVHIVACQSATRVQARERAPCVLVREEGARPGASFRYSLLALSGADRPEPCVQFKLPYDMRDNVSILRGPGVAWSHAGGVFHASPRTAQVRQAPLRWSHCVIGELPLREDAAFVLGLAAPAGQGPDEARAVGCFVESGHVFDVGVMMPRHYVGVARCVLVLCADRAGDALSCALVAATSRRQLVAFENGAVKDARRLPFDRPERVQVVDTGRRGCLFVVSFHQGHVCALWKDTLQIASRWSGVSSVHVEDFLGCGTDQVLLVFNDEDGVTEQPLGRFLLTDLCGISYSCGQDGGAPKTPPPPPENELLTLRALEARLQSGMTVLQELRAQARVRDRVLQQSIRSLADAASEEKTILTGHEQEGLSALWDSEEEDDDEDEYESTDEKTPAVSSKPQVDKLWHRVSEERLVVGVMLSTDSSTPLASVSLSILTETGQGSTPAVIQSQVFCLPAPCSSSSSSSSPASTFLEPAAKRSKQHHVGRPTDLNACRLAVTAVARLTPLLNSGCVKCRVMIHYVQGRDVFAIASNPTPVVMHCGDVAVDINHHFQTPLLIKPELKTDETEEDLLSLMALLDHRVLRIHSPDHSLDDIDGWIKKMAGCRRVEVNPQYLLLNSSGASAPMLLHWNQMSPFQGELAVHSSQLQALQFLDPLLAHLPVRCRVQSVKGTRGRGAAQIWSLALEKELVSLREGVSLLLCEEEEEEEEKDRKRKSLEHEETPPPGSPKELQRRREAFQEDVERSETRLSPLVDAGRYRTITQSMSELQLLGDLAALLNTPTALCNDR